MNLPRSFRGVTALVVVFVAAACTGGGGEPIELEEVTTGSVSQTIAAPATLAPAARRTVTAPASGRVAEILVESGDRVEAGELVLRLESTSLEAAIGQAQAGLDAAGALGGITPAVDLSVLIEPIRSQVQEVVPPALDALEAQAEEVDDEDVRAQLLLRLNDARTRYREVVDDLARAEAEARATARRSTAAQRAAAEAQRRQAQAALDAAQEREDELAVTSPITGVIELSEGDEVRTAAPNVGAELPPEVSGLLGGSSGGGPVAVGADVGVGQPLFTVYDLSRFHAEATVDEVDAIEVASGQVAEIFVEAYQDRTFDARVSDIGIAPAEGRAGGVVYPVTVRFQDDLDGITFRVGMTASVEIVVEEVDDAMVVPSRALLVRDGRDVVLVSRSDDGAPVARTVEVELLAVGEERAAVEGELEVGEDVVVSGFEDLEDGDPIPG